MNSLFLNRLGSTYGYAEHRKCKPVADMALVQPKQLYGRCLGASPGACRKLASHGLKSRAGCLRSSRRNALLAANRRSVSVYAVFEKFTERSIKAVMIAQQEAKNMGSMEVNTEHILLGLVSEENLSKNGYLNSGIIAERAKAAIESLYGRKKPIVSQDSIPFSRDVRRMFEAATNECKRSGVNFISPEHIFLAIIGVPDGVGRKVFMSLGADYEAAKREAYKRLKGDSENDAAVKKKKQEKNEPKALQEYCRDLCAEVKQGRIDPVIGREKEVARVMQILARRTKNNPILLGEPGVGKTAIAEGLALAIVHRVSPDGTPLPQFLENKRVMQLDVGLIIAGAKERGELESRITQLIAEVKESGNVVLMIDEIHTLVGSGTSGRGGGTGGLDISNMLKPALARGEFQVLGATTIDEHRKYIEKDAALERRFQPVLVDEPTPEQTLQILMGLREKYERHHRCAYSEEALEAAVKLSHKYIADRFLPDKAIDLLDEAGSRARITAFMARRAAADSENPKVREYIQVLEAKDDVVSNSLFEEAVILRRREVDYRAELAGHAEDGSSLPIVMPSDIEVILSAWTGLPIESLNAEESQRLLHLNALLEEHIIGQDDAVMSVTAAMRRARSGLKDPDRPIATLLFVGPTGVGKTELVKVLAEQYFGSRDAVIRLDMSEYMERHSVSKLVGAPPGYIGFGEGGKLTEAVRRKPSSIVLFDEIEKAHPDVFSILLQIMEDGRLTDSTGRTVNFKNTLVILTSNIGSRAISLSGNGRQGMFMKGPMPDDEAWQQQNQAFVHNMVLDEVKTFFRPELLNRLDEQVVFNKLSRTDVRVIAKLMLTETAKRVQSKGWYLEVTQRLMDRIVADGFSDEYGVRPLRQTIVHYIDDPLCEALLNLSMPPGSILTVDINDDDSVTVTDRMETVTVTGHSCGYNGQVIVMNDMTEEGQGNGVERSRQYVSAPINASDN